MRFRNGSNRFRQRPAIERFAAATGDKFNPGGHRPRHGHSLEAALPGMASRAPNCSLAQPAGERPEEFKP